MTPEPLRPAPIRWSEWGPRPRQSLRREWIFFGVLVVLGSVIVTLGVRGMPYFFGFFPIFIGIGANRMRSVEKLRERLGGDAGELGVESHYYAGTLEIGTDRGLLCLEDGWLIHRGERTEWSIRADDVRMNPLTMAFAYPGPEGTTRGATLAPLDPADGGRVRRLMEEWRRTSAEGPSVLPPALAERIGVAPNGLLTFAVGAAAGIAAISLYFDASWSWIAALMVPLVVFGSSEFFGRRRARRALLAAKALPAPRSEPASQSKTCSRAS